jgi:UDP-N-acetylmuramyl tripeptide synthase
VIAVTGTSGKTTTAWLAAAVLAEAGLRVGVLSDLGCLDADGAAPTPANLARPKVLAAWLRRLVDGGCTHVVIEVSSAMLAADCLAGIACDTVVVTNIASAHLDLHGTPAAYRAVKARILDSLAPDGCLVTDADDPRARRLARRHLRARPQGGPSATLVTTALRRNADVTASPVERSLAGQTFLVRAGGHAVPVAVTTPVASFARDALLAATQAAIAGGQGLGQTSPRNGQGQRRPIDPVGGPFG